MARRGGGWPDEDQLLLLHAVLDAPEPATAAWRRWATRHDEIAGLPDATRRLLPQLARRLDALGAGGPLAGQVRERLPYTWTRNRMLVRTARPALRALDARGITAVALKGAAVAATIEGGMGTRPMFDLDLLVRAADVHSAAAGLAEAGFEDVSPLGWQATIEVASGAGFRAADGTEIDLHWRPIPHPVALDAVFAAARPVELGDAPVLVPAPEDVLVHACVHGLSSGSSGPRWILDAALVLRAAGERFDWDRVAALTWNPGVALVVAKALRHLRDEFGVHVPARALVTPATIGERVVHSLATSPARFGPLAFHAEQWGFYAVIERDRGRRPTAGGFLDHEAHRAGAADRAALLRHWRRRSRQRLLARALRPQPPAAAAPGNGRPARRRRSAAAFR